MGSDCAHDLCITCGDTALALTVLAVEEASALAACADEAGRRETVDVTLVPDVRPGEMLLVHAGTALQRLAEAAPA